VLRFAWVKKVAAVTLQIIGWFIVLGCVLPFLRTDEWFIRVFDFPRLQLLAGAAITLPIAAVLFARSSEHNRWLLVLTVALAAALTVQVLHIIPYTRVSRPQVKNASDPNPRVTLSVMIANVLMTNRNAAGLLAMVEREQPEVLVLTEIDDYWERELAPLKRAYPFGKWVPQTNTYGIALLSRKPISPVEVRHLTDREVPSLRTTLRLQGEILVDFHAVHPRPPVLKEPGSIKPQDSNVRDAELVQLARTVSKGQNPVIVAGDFNDVAWSQTTRLFQRLSGLLDPRKGRGLFNTFHAKHVWLRYPLDHLFHSEEFTVLGIRRLEAFGSDHFPILVKLAFEPAAARVQPPPAPKPGDKQQAREMIEEHKEEKQRTRPDP
jgi:endonuclease/exonuclease/phosphatase (EEP) superfamily protein YafD